MSASSIFRVAKRVNRDRSYNLLAVGHTVEELAILLLIHRVNSNVKVPLLAVVVHVSHFTLPAMLAGSTEGNLRCCRRWAFVDNHESHSLGVQHRVIAGDRRQTEADATCTPGTPGGGNCNPTALSAK